MVRASLRIGSIGLVSIVAVLGVATPAPAASTYRDPPSYKGVKKVPKTKPPSFPTTSLSSAGTFPDVLVDEAGTAHIVWNEGRGNNADVAVYCRLKRGATSCDRRKELRWDKTYGAGDGPQYNTDDGGPRIVRIGNQLLVLSKRYPTIGSKPDGDSSNTVVGWVSNDGGTSWSDARVLGKRDLGQLAVAGPANNPTVVNLGYDPFCGGMCLSRYVSGVYSTDEGVLNTDPNSNYNATLARDGAGLIAGFSDLQPRIWLRRWSGSGSVTNPANWSTSAPLPGDEPELADGPAGPFLMQRPGYSGPLQVRPLAVGAANKVTAGPAKPITPDTGARYGQLQEDGSGRLLAAWQQDGSGVQLRTSKAGASGFEPAQRLIAGNGNGQISLDAYRDGGGFSVLNHTGGVNSAGQIVAVGFGNQAATGRRGIANVPGGAGDVTCQRVGFGDFAIKTTEGCFLQGTGDSAGVVVTSGEITLNGLRIVPDPGARLVIDPKKLTIDTIGQVRVLVSNGSTQVVLFHGELHRDLSGLKPGSRLFEFPQQDYQANVLGFDVAAGLPVILTRDGVRIPIDVELPAAFGGFTGHAELLAKEGSGLVLDSLHIHIGPVPLGVLVIENLDIDYRSGQTWTGSGKLTFPTQGSIAANFRFDAGEFGGAGFDYTLAPPATIGPFVYLLSVGGDFFLKPETKIAARASIGAGAAVQGQAPVKVNGQFTMTFPPNGPGKFSLNGDVDVFVVQIANGYLVFDTSGYARFYGHTGLDLGPLSGGVDVNGFVDGANGQFSADINGDAKFCMNVKGPPAIGTVNVCGDVGAAAAVSSIGFAACAHLNPPDPIGGFSGGLAMRWDDLSPAVLASPVVATAQLIEAITVPCHTSAYRIPPPRPVAAGIAARAGQGLAVPSGLPSATILVRSAGGVPDVTVRGPGGEVITPGGSTKDGFVLGAPGAKAAWIVLDKPQGGTWTVTPNGGSPPVSNVLLSQGYTPATVKAHVRKGRIAYRIKHLGHGQKVAFRESGKFGGRVIGSARHAKGKLSFKPAPGPGGKRRITALIMRDGLVTDKKVVGSYKAPGPKRPGRVKGLKLHKHGSSLVVSFHKAKRAARTEILVSGHHGADLAELLPGRKHKARFGALRWEKRLTVKVRAFSSAGRAGPVAKRVLRAGG